MINIPKRLLDKYYFIIFAFAPVQYIRNHFNPIPDGVEIIRFLDGGLNCVTILNLPLNSKSYLVVLRGHGSVHQNYTVYLRPT